MFLAEMETVAPSKALMVLIQPRHPETSTKGGRPPYLLAAQHLACAKRLLRIQQWHSLSDPGMEEALIKVPTMRLSAGIDMIRDRISGKTTILKFRHLLGEKQNLGEQICQTVKALLRERGMAMKQGTIIDAILVAAPSSSKQSW